MKDFEREYIIRKIVTRLLDSWIENITDEQILEEFNPSANLYSKSREQLIEAVKEALMTRIQYRS